VDRARKGAEVVERNDLDLPKGLSVKARNAAEAIIRFLKELEMTETVGCRAFYSPKEWAARDEEYGRNAALIVVHDGGDLARFFNHDYRAYDMIEEMRNRLDQAGAWAEACTSWYTAIYTR
jgi:hypothetical protein